MQFANTYSFTQEAHSELDVYNHFWNLKLAFRPALFWVITQRIAIISYRLFGTTYGPVFMAEDGPDRLSRNVGKKLPLLAA
jgi:hypothetical protein